MAPHWLSAAITKMHPDPAVRQAATRTASAFRLYEVNQECAPIFGFIGSDARPTKLRTIVRVP
jgi:hypothetical protein